MSARTRGGASGYKSGCGCLFYFALMIGGVERGADAGQEQRTGTD